MRRHLGSTLALVHLDRTTRVDRVSLVRIDGDTEQAGVGVDQLGEVALLQIVQHGRVVQVGQVGHVLTLLVLWRVHLRQQVFLDGTLRFPGNRSVSIGLAFAEPPVVTYIVTLATLDDHHVALRLLDVTQDVALFFVRHPDHLLAIVRLALVFSLLLKRDEQVFAWIRIFSHCSTLANFLHTNTNQSTENF